MTHHIDKIMYINLNRRTDRREQIENELTVMGLMDKSIRFEAIDRPGKGIVGCTYSHLECLKYARDQKWKNVLILEDDFTFTMSKEAFEKNLSDFFETNLPYDVCMISYLLFQSEPTEYPFLTKVNEAQTASGYIVHEKFYDVLIHLYEYFAPILDETMEHWHYANDQIWKHLQPSNQWYCLTTRCGKQRSGYSDNAQCYFDYDA